MLAPDDYHAVAEECFRRAREAKIDNKRQDYLDLAQRPNTAGSRITSGLQRFAFYVAIMLSEELRFTPRWDREDAERFRNFCTLSLVLGMIIDAITA